MNVQGNVGVALNAESGSSIHINVTQAASNEDPALLAAVGQLLNLAKEHNFLNEIQEISNQLYGTKFFKSLELGQLEALQVIAGQMAGAIGRVTEALTMPEEPAPKSFWRQFFGF